MKIKVRWKSAVAWLLLLGLAVVGCTHTPADAPAGAAKQAAAEKPVKHAPAGAVKVQPVDAAGLAQFRGQNQGKVLLVDFWATWCEPCKDFFPHSVALQRRFGARGLQVIPVSLDDAEQLPDVRDFLWKTKAQDLPNFVSRSGVDPQTMTDFEIDGGAIPHLKLYDRHGKLRQKFGSGGGPLSPSAIDKAIEQLLSET